VAYNPCGSAPNKPDTPAPCFTLRADDRRHIWVLVAGLRWAEQEFGPVNAFTQSIAGAIREFEAYRPAEHADAKPPTLTLRAGGLAHFRLLIAALRWSERQYGVRDTFTQQIRTAVRECEVYRQTQGIDKEVRRPHSDLRWPRF